MFEPLVWIPRRTIVAAIVAVAAETGLTILLHQHQELGQERADAVNVVECIRIRRRHNIHRYRRSIHRQYLHRLIRPQLLHLRHRDQRGLSGPRAVLRGVRYHGQEPGHRGYRGLANVASAAVLLYSAGFRTVVYPCAPAQVPSAVEFMTSLTTTNLLVVLSRAL